MKNNIRYGTIFNYRLNEWTDNIDSSKTNAGSGRGVFIVIPFLIIVVLFEFIWIRLLGGNIERYNDKNTP
jgi:hypothetical protein